MVGEIFGAHAEFKRDTGHLRGGRNQRALQVAAVDRPERRAVTLDRSGKRHLRDLAAAGGAQDPQLPQGR